MVGGLRRLFVHDLENRAQTILHIKIRFPLVPIPEHTKTRRILQQLSVEIEYVPVRVTLPENRNEPEDITLKAESLAVRLDHRFTSDLRCRIKRGLDWKRRILRSWNHRRFAINRTGGRKRDLFNSITPHRFQDVERGYRILLEILPRMFEPEPHIRIGGQVKNHVGAGHCLRQVLQFEVVSGNEKKARVLFRAVDKLGLPRRKIVPADDLPVLS